MRNEAISRQAEIPTELIHAAMERLPEKYRLAVLLHHLQGRTEEETAAQLGCSLSAASVRLARGRKMLRERLAVRGVTASIAGVVGVMAAEVAGAAVSPAWASAVAHSATALAAGQAAGASAGILNLAKEAAKILFWTKLKIAMITVASVALMIGGVGAFKVLAQDASTPQPLPPAIAQANAPAAPAAAANTPSSPDLTPGSYAVTRLGTLGGRTSWAAAINASGDIVGVADTARVAMKHAFIYHDGKMQDLGTLGGDNSEAHYINDAGQIVGEADIPTPANQDSDAHAFLYDHDAMHDLGTLGGAISSAYGINASGQIVGQSNIDQLGLAVNQPPNHAFLYANGMMHDMGGSGGLATAINDTGLIAGSSLFLVRDGFSVRQGMLIDHGNLKKLNLPDGQLSIATAINASGWIAGEFNRVMSEPNKRLVQMMHAFSYRDGAMTDLGSLGGTASVARAINAAGDIVGYAEVPGNIQHAFIFHNGKMSDLNELVEHDALAAAGFRNLQCALGINDHGQIVGYGTDLHGIEIALILNPTTK